MPPTDHENKTGTKLVEIIRALDEHGDMGVTELGAAVGMPKSTVHYHLRTLREEGLVIKTDGKYRLGLQFLQIGGQVRRRIPVYEGAKGEINDLADETDDLVILMSEERGLGVYLYKAAGENAIDIDAPIGRFATLHNRALGKAILAHMAETRVEEIIAEYGLPQTSEHTISTPGKLFDEIEQIRDAGVAYNREESLEGIHGVAVPLLDADDSVLGAISIAGPAEHLRGEKFTETYPDLLSKARNVIELNLQHPYPPTDH